LYKHRFGSFYYEHVTRKKAAETMFVRKICAFKVDEIDGSASQPFVWHNNKNWKKL